MEDIFKDVTLSTSNYDSILTGWSNQALQDNVTFNGGNSIYSSSSASSRQSIIDTFNWTITDAGEVPDNIAPTTPTLITQPALTTSDNNISIIVNGEVDANISVDGTPVGTIGTEGNSSLTLSLNSGINNFYITLIDASGNESSPLTFSVTKTGLFSLKKTGQTKSYDTDGTEVLDNTLKDDGFYQKGADTNYTRDDNNETVIDHLTGLMWQDDPAVESVTKQWVTQANYDAQDYNNTVGDTATTYCNELVMGGFEDWRLPTVVELQGILNDGRYGPSIDEVFINTYNNYYWSSTSPQSLHNYAWIVYFGYGNTLNGNKGNSNYVRCVRAGQ
jgi:hypothetical protein